jgi:hypothetical protein
LSTIIWIFRKWLHYLHLKFLDNFNLYFIYQNHAQYIKENIAISFITNNSITVLTISLTCFYFSETVQVFCQNLLIFQYGHMSLQDSLSIFFFFFWQLHANKNLFQSLSKVNLANIILTLIRFQDHLRLHVLLRGAHMSNFESNMLLFLQSEAESCTELTAH